MNIYTVILGVGIAIAIFFAGVEYQRRAALSVQIEQLKDDAKAVTAIDTKDEKRQTDVKTIVQVVRESVPVDDCLNRPMPDAALDGLLNAGIRARP